MASRWTHQDARRTPMSSDFDHRGERVVALHTFPLVTSLPTLDRDHAQGQLRKLLMLARKGAALTSDCHQHDRRNSRVIAEVMNAFIDGVM